MSSFFFFVVGGGVIVFAKNRIKLFESLIRLSQHGVLWINNVGGGLYQYLSNYPKVFWQLFLSPPHVKLTYKLSFSTSLALITVCNLHDIIQNFTKFTGSKQAAVAVNECT